MPLIRLAAPRGPNSSANPVNGIVMLLSDWTVRDLSMSLNNYSTPPYGADRARKLLAVSPNSPSGMAQLIQDAWGEAEKQVDEWQKVVGNHPTFVAAMARHYVKAGRTDEAERA